MNLYDTDRDASHAIDGRLIRHSGDSQAPVAWRHAQWQRAVTLVHTRNGTLCRVATLGQPAHLYQVLTRHFRSRLQFRLDSSTIIAAGTALLLTIFALWMNYSALNAAPEQASQAEPSVTPTAVHTVNISQNSIQKVDLLFNSPSDLAAARISIQLPANVELAGFPGEQSVSWTENIRHGSNMLTLALKANNTAEGHLIARIEHNGKIKTLHIRLNVTPKVKAPSTSNGRMA